MNQGTRKTRERTTSRPAGAGGSGGELTRAKMALVAACERADPNALVTILATYPAHAPELIEFNAALKATAGYEHEALTAESEAVANRAYARAMARVFGASASGAEDFAPAAAMGVAQGVVATLAGLRRARGMTPRALGQRLGLGVDVVTSLEHGLIRVATIPERLVKALADALGANLDQITTVLTAQPVIRPKYQRQRPAQAGSVESTEPAELDFAEAVRVSPNMSPEEKARWIEQ
ncbi:MAG TPA: helix-turn-helix transcriptional regulator [Ktedonobacterales bacterium]|nr:helix-turn-helix transcriptional regulator [Ktedonobacterales bacterium]